MKNPILKEAALKHRNLILSPYDAIMDVVGYEGISVISEYLGGSTVYIPTVKRIFYNCLMEELNQRFDGDYRALARNFGVSERHVRRLLNKNKLPA